MARLMLAATAVVLCLATVALADEATCAPGAAVCPAPGATVAVKEDRPGILSRVGDFFTGWIKRVFVPGANGVPLGYLTDMMQALGPEFSWLKVFCKGKTAGCDKPKSWPGPQTRGIGGYYAVKEAIASMPRNEWSGEWWRGNELGTLINNPFFYSLRDEGANETWLSPMSIALGISPKQHAAVRPVFEAALIKKGPDAAKYLEYIDRTAEELVAKAKEKGRLEHYDLKIWFQKVVNKLSFDREVTDEYAADFLKLQGEMLPGQLRSQLLPKFLYGRDPMKLKPILERLRKFVLEFEVLVSDKYAHLLEGQDCSPSKSCEKQAAYALVDAHMAAGGVSVPGTLLQALAVVFSTDASNPAGKALGDYKPEEAMQLHWEAIRIFPPVVVFPYWNPRPTCEGLNAKQTADLSAPHGETKPCPLGHSHKSTGYPPVNQYKDGVRYLPNVAMAQLDTEIWGADGESFRLRPLEMYEKYSQGFCEAAEDSSVADGRMNRSCPGRGLALIMGKAFLSRFRPKEWVVDPNKPITIKTGGPYVGDFVMYLKENIDKCIKDKCNCEDSNPTCSCDKAKECYQ